MVVLRGLLKGKLLAGSASLAISLVQASTGFAAVPYGPDPFAKNREEASKKLCKSTDEYIKTLTFLRTTKEFTYREEISREIATTVARSCDGAAERFSQVLLLLKTVGLSERRSLAMALEFAGMPTETQKNFVEIFSKAFLTEFFDYEYGKALKLALELSTGYQGDPARARQDFIALARFCKDSNELDLPVPFCAEYATKVAKLSHHFDGGVSKPFFALFKELREKKELSLDVKTALELSYEILAHGPLAPKNFEQGFAFASKDHEFDKKKALAFGLDMARRSHVDEKPPVMQFAPLPSTLPTPPP